MASITCMCQPKSPNSSQPHPIPCLASIHLSTTYCHYFCFADKIIYTIFLDLTFMHQYMILVFLLLTYLWTLSRSNHVSANDPTYVLLISYKTELGSKIRQTQTKRFTHMWMSGGALENLSGCSWCRTILRIARPLAFQQHLTIIKSTEPPPLSPDTLWGRNWSCWKLALLLPFPWGGCILNNCDSGTDLYRSSSWSLSEACTLTP